MTRRRRIAYVVSRFPARTQTFVIRELNALADGFSDVSLGLLSLFPSHEELLHASMARWTEQVQRPALPEAAAAMAWWGLRRPQTLLGAALTVAWRCRRSPPILLRSLATLPIAAAHARRMRGAGVDHLHCHFASYPTLAAWLIRRLTGIPYSFTAHAYDLFVDQSMLAPKVSEAELVVTISEHNRRFLRPYGGGDATPVHIVHYGIDPREYPFRPRPIPAAGPISCLCVGALEEKKGHSVLFEAIAGGGEDLDRLRLSLVGDGPLRESLAAQVDELGLAERVRFLGGQSESAVRELLDSAELFVLASIIAANGQMEGLPNALIEALAVGLTAVSTEQSGIPELIREGETGFLARPGDPADLAATLSRAIASGGLDGHAGRELVEAEFDIRVSARQMHELLVGTAGDLG